jgi:hypothetical protein
MCATRKPGTVRKICKISATRSRVSAKAVPKLLIQVGGSISFAPLEGGDKAKWLNYDTRHILTELTPKPDQVTITINIVQMNVTEIMTQDDIAGPRWQTQKCSRPTARW